MRVGLRELAGFESREELRREAELGEVEQGDVEAEEVEVESVEGSGQRVESLLTWVRRAYGGAASSRG